MKVHAQKQSQSQQQASPSVTSSSAKPLATHSTVHPILHLQHTIGNQAVQRLLSASTEGLGLPALQRQAKSGGDLAVQTEEPSPKALELLEKFMKERATFKGSGPAAFNTEYDDKKNVIETVRDVKMPNFERKWTYTFVTFTRGNTECTYVKESLNGTQITNYYEKCITTSVEIQPFWYVITNNNIFIEGTGKFDFSSTHFLEFYENLDKVLKDAPDITYTPILITIDGPSNPVNLARANTIKEDLMKRKVNKHRISIAFGGKAESPLILIQSTSE